MQSIEQCILKYLEFFGFATPKHLLNALSPCFNYSQDTLRRKIHRKLRKLDIVKHKLRPFYVHPERIHFFNDLLLSQHFSYLYNPKIIVANWDLQGKEPSYRVTPENFFKMLKKLEDGNCQTYKRAELK